MGLFEISGFWNDVKTEFEGYIVSPSDEIDEVNDDDIFFYGLSEEDIKEAIRHPERTCLEFTITSYSKLETI